MVSKTREKLIDVARQLFMKKGVENTTMNDIAAASEKGRRTIYTYFKNKREIYNAVVEQQSEILIHGLREVALSELPPLEKLEKYLNTRFRLFDEFHLKNERSRFFFRGDHRRIAKVLRLAVDKEKTLLKTMMDEGIESGDFDPSQARRLPSLEILLSQGIDLSRIAETGTEEQLESLRHDVTAFIISGIRSKQSTI